MIPSDRHFRIDDILCLTFFAQKKQLEKNRWGEEAD